MGEGEEMQNVLHDAAIAGCGGREGVESRLRVANYYPIQAAVDK